MEKGCAKFFEITQRSFFVDAHQPAVADDIARQDCRQTPLDAFLGHSPSVFVCTLAGGRATEKRAAPEAVSGPCAAC
jgi:hypothetical protein